MRKIDKEHKKVITAIILIIVELALIIGITKAQTNEASDGKQYITVYDDRNLEIGIDTKSITYDKKLNQVKFNIEATNSNFEQYNLAIENTCINDDTKNTKQIYFGEELGSNIVYDDKNNRVKDRTAIVELSNSIDKLDSIELNFAAINNVYNVELYTKNLRIEKSNGRYVLVDKATTDKSRCKGKWDNDREKELMKNNQDNGTSIIGTHKLGLVATKSLINLEDIKSTDDNFYAASNDYTFEISAVSGKDFEGEKATEIEQLKALDNIDNVEIKDYTKDNVSATFMKKETDNNYIVYQILVKDDTLDNMICIKLSSYKNNVDIMNNIINEVIDTYTLVDIRGLNK